MSTKTTWHVRVTKPNGTALDLGTVVESTEEFARAAALNKFGATDEDGRDTDNRITLEDEFSVTPG